VLIDFRVRAGRFRLPHGGRGASLSDMIRRPQSPGLKQRQAIGEQKKHANTCRLCRKQPESSIASLLLRGAWLSILIRSGWSTENEEIARMTIVAHTESGARIGSKLAGKLVDVLLAENISTRALLERDLALIKVSADQQNRPT